MTELAQERREALAEALHAWICCDDWQDIAHEKNVSPDFREGAAALATLLTTWREQDRAAGAAEAVERVAHVARKHSVTRSSFAGPPVETVTLDELPIILRAALTEVATDA